MLEAIGVQIVGVRAAERDRSVAAGNEAGHDGPHWRGRSRHAREPSCAPLRKAPSTIGIDPVDKHPRGGTSNRRPTDVVSHNRDTVAGEINIPTADDARRIQAELELDLRDELVRRVHVDVGGGRQRRQCGTYLVLLNQESGWLAWRAKQLLNTPARKESPTGHPSIRIGLRANCTTRAKQPNRRR